MARDLNAYIFPPVKIEIWGGNNSKKLKKLYQLIPKAQKKDSVNAEMLSYKCSFVNTAVGYLKVVATPIARLPKWHKAKGEKGWIFIDEIFLN
jgi:hypothetical protein